MNKEEVVIGNVYYLDEDLVVVIDKSGFKCLCKLAEFNPFKDYSCNYPFFVCYEDLTK